MKQENKELLLKYLCMALPYDVVVRCYFVDGGGEEVLDTDDIADLLYNEENSEFPMYKPYLRPMSSMTYEEKKEISNLLNYEFYVDTDYALSAEDGRHRIGLDLIQIYINWLLKNHFDFMGLIPKNLAIEVTKENNPYEQNKS